MIHINLEHEKFGELKVLEKTNKRKHQKVIWLCKCDCGKCSEVTKGELTSGNTKSCGCCKLINESVVFDIIKKIYKNKKIKRHYKAKWLGCMHFDIYIPELKTAIEYQGKQHFMPVDLFGGEETFKKQNKYDKRKKEICNKNKINLIEINYNDELTEDFILNKINEEICNKGEKNNEYYNGFRS